MRQSAQRHSLGANHLNAAISNMTYCYQVVMETRCIYHAKLLITVILISNFAYKDFYVVYYQATAFLLLREAKLPIL